MSLIIMSEKEDRLPGAQMITLLCIACGRPISLPLAAVEQRAAFPAEGPALFTEWPHCRRPETKEQKGNA